MKHRLFVALEIPEGHRRVIVTSRSSVENALPACRWIPEQSQHLTLKFLGDTDPATESDVIAALSKLRLPPISVTFHGGGFFPPRGPARVAWLGGQAEGGATLAGAVDAAVAPLGFARERRPWTLHLTQARLRKRWSEAHRRTYLDWADGLELPAFECCGFSLFASQLRPDGAVYTPIQQWRLC